MSTKFNRVALFSRIIDVLKKNPYGLSSTDLSKKLDINRMTLVKYLSVMQARGMVEFKNIGMAKVWHTSTKYDLVDLITQHESSSIHTIISGKKTSIRPQSGDFIPLSLFRATKAALGLSKDPQRAMFQAGKFISKSCFPNGGIASAEIISDNLCTIFCNLKLGILEPVQLNPVEWAFKLDESASAYNTSFKGNNLCHFEAGLIAGYVENIIKKDVLIKETKCIGTGSAYCEFLVNFKAQKDSR